MNTVTVIFPALSENEPFARSVAAAFCMRFDPTLDELSDVKTAVSEAVTNCIVHAYAGMRRGNVCMECAAEGDTLHITVSDSGKGIEDVARAVEPFFTTLEEEERSGMGFTIMQTFMTAFSVQSAPGKGTQVRMQKRFGAPAAEKARSCTKEAGQGTGRGGLPAGC